MFKRGDIVLRHPMLMNAMFSERIRYVENVKTTKKQVKYTFLDIHGNMHFETISSGNDREYGYYRLHEGNLPFTSLERSIISHVLLNPGSRLNNINIAFPHQGGVSGVQSTLKRIAKKGFSSVFEYVEPL